MSIFYDSYIRSYCLDRERDRVFFDIVGDLYDSPQVQGQQIYRQHSSINRLDHVRSVTYLSFTLAEKLGLDARAAARGAMLHDLVYYDWHDKARWHRPHGFKHPRFALKNAKALNTEITPKEENIILRHMWPLTVIPPKYAEGWVVTIADKYCATREMLRAEHPRFQRDFTVRKRKYENMRP
ncbi:MAG: HD domain-containing protein [Clostridia bacterium]|nr:HD domain-containing protein [Clostridia bacterium]